MSQTTDNQFALRIALNLIRDDAEAAHYAIEEASESMNFGEMLIALATPFTALIIEKFGGTAEAEAQLQNALEILASNQAKGPTA